MYNKKTVLITGASQGIGYEFVKIFSEAGYNLILVARSEEKLEENAQEMKEKFGTVSKIITKDLSLPNAAQELYNKLKKEKIQVDILVNNAGAAKNGPYLEIPVSEDISQVMVNCTALTVLTKLFAKDMVERGEGKILNISSLSGFMPGPLMSVYYATKAYVLSFSEAIANELEGTGVTVTALCPGPTRSGFEKREGIQNSLLFRFNSMNAATVAHAGYDGLMAGKTVVIPGFINKTIVQLLRVAPRKLVPNVVHKMQKRR